MSNPIVTPVTDEFPTEEEAERKSKTEIAEPKTAPEKKMQRKVAQVVDYKGKKKKKGKEGSSHQLNQTNEKGPTHSLTAPTRSA
ncbi:hypothetical protein TELCIR_20931 [Teladorsagia circumcincta]|uniref:Uncharacterized protein n=1 Tax=Teladorsagia circumcincta TaxID=45464 RepID=A0A2G9TI44_TELCI|nr:hypothetical protein TELCIR_20931 [Teladorsagia circumcincta]